MPTADLLAGDRLDVETELLSQLHDDPDAVRLPMLRLVSAGGKRLRPLLVLACARLGGPADRSALQLAVAFEMLHTATLVHDDYVDDAARRRGRPSVSRAEGPAVAIAVGDYYFAKATRLTACLGCPEVSLTVARAVERICLSQIHEVRLRSSYPGDRETYLDVVRGKTAALFEAACRSGAEIGSAAPDAIERVGRFGDLLGLAFQMRDDVLDYCEGTGKPLAQDIRQRVMSLPLIYAGEDPELGERARELLSSPPSDLVVDQLLQLVGATGALARVQAEALANAEDALGEARCLPLPDVREALTEVVGFAMSDDG